MRRKIFVNSAQRVIDKFGGQSRLASLLGRTPSTVQYWANSGSIPTKWQGRLLALAKEQGIELYPGDFVEVLNTDIQPTEDVKKPLPVAKWPGILVIGNTELPVYVLDDGRRVITRNSATQYITNGKGGGNLEAYIGIEPLKEYLPDTLPEQLIEIVIPEVVHKTVLGMSAETFLDICSAYVRALDEGKLKTNRQIEIATKAGVFLAACSKVGLTALIDEATGYQYVRSEEALQLKLRLYLEEEMRKWELTFPEELWKEFGRLTHWKGSLIQRPKYWGRLVMELIYDYLDPDVAEWLRKNNPKPQKGQNHHQWLSGQYGLKKLTEHIWRVVGMAQACNSMRELQTKMAEIYGRQPIQETLFLPPPTVAARPPRSKERKSPSYESQTPHLWNG
jgi:hypothetical protein